MNTPFPPPPAAPEKKRKLWPWFLGGCLLLILLAVGAFVAVGYFGLKALGTATKDVIANVPAVQEHFGAVSDAGMDFGAMSASGGSAMVFKITGEKGEGRLSIQLDPATQQFKSATLTLPNGDVHEIDQTTLEQLKALQQGQMPIPQP
jgi:hypothetical protein